MNCQKLLVLGLAAIISTNAFAQATPTEQSIEILTKQVQILQERNIIPKINVNYIVKPAEEINKTRVEAIANLDIVEHNCTVNINVTPDMKIGHSGSNENREALKEVTGPSNEKQEQLRTSYITYHETSHCKLYEVKNPFRAADKDAENALNNYFQLSQTSYDSKHGDIGIFFMLQENFADTFAYMQMIKDHGVGKDVLSTLQKIQVERSDAANEHNKNGLIAHNTEFSLKEVLKEENIKKIMATESQEELQELALKIANNGMWKSIKTHNTSKYASQITNMESLIGGAGFLLNEVLLKDLPSDTPLNESSQKNVNLHLEDNALYQVAKETKSEINKKFDLSSIKTRASMSEFYTKNYEEISGIIQEKLSIQMDADYPSGNGPFDVIEKHYKSVEAGAKQSLPELKANGAEAIKAAEDLAAKLSVNSVLKNMASIRQASLNSPNKTVHVKYGQ
jgi:uncharacterized OsmC-like protein